MTVTTTYGWNQSSTGFFANNLVTTGNQASAAVTRVGANGFALAWNDGATAGDVNGRFFSDATTPVGNEFVLNSSTAALQSSPALTTLPDGRVAVAFVDAGTNSGSVRVRVLSSAGAPSGAEFIVSSGGARSQPDIAALANGNLVVSYTLTYGTTDPDANFQIFTPSGSLVAGRTFNNSSSVASSMSSVAALTSGGFVAAWTDQPISGGNQTLYTQRFDASGAPVDANPVSRDPYGNINGDAQILGLQDGGFAVAYTDDGWNVSGTEITLQIFNADGTARTSYLRANQTVTDGDQNRPSLTQLDGGIIVVGWATGSTEYLAAFLPNGTPLPGSETANSAATVEAEMVALSGGVIEQVRSSSSSDAGSDQSIRSVTYEISRTSTGDNTANTFTGDGLRDVMYGGSAADVFYGMEGNDTITPGGGNDAVDGGAGIDTVVFSGPRAAYQIGRSSIGPAFVTITDTRTGSPDGSDITVNVEKLQFSDFAKPALITLGSDLGADGRSDLVFRDTASGTIVAWNGAQSGTAVALGQVGASAYEMKLADLNGDGRTDFVFRNTSNGLLVLWDHGSSGAASVLGSVGTDYEIFTPDLNGNGKADLFFHSKSSGALVVWDDGDSSRAHLLGNLGSEWSISTGDLEADGKTDLVFLSSNTGALVEWSGGNSNAGRLLGTLGTGWRVVSANADFNADGQSDLTFFNTTSGNVVVWTDGDPGRASFKGTVPANTEVITGDFNGDGLSDLLFRNPSTGAMTVWDGGNAASAHGVGSVAASYQLFG